MPLDFRNTNTLWGSVLAETLARCGVTLAVSSPGSRSTPVTLALVEHGGIEVIPILDERSAAFFALGAARQSRRPVVLICSSGSAGGHYLPAIIEAHESRTPLIAITADRPPELHDCASGQTIDQQKFFGHFVDWSHSLAVPEASVERLRYLRQTIAHAVVHAWNGNVVHLNAPFRDPLSPTEDASARPLAGKIDDAFFAHLQPPILTDDGAARPEEIVLTAARGLIVAGPTGWENPDGFARTVEALARTSGWPVLADGLSPLREHASSACALVTSYDTILRDESFAANWAPEQVLCLGEWPISKVLRAWLEKHQPGIFLVNPDARNRDALHGRTQWVRANPENLRLRCEGADAAYRQAWLDAETAARGALDARLGDDDSTLSESRVAWLLAQVLPADSALCVANSMAVRNIEFFWPATQKRRRLFFSRGANGIDGTLSTALGVAHRGRPTVLLTGDLALLHDSNGFLLHRELRGSLTVVLVNNAGGGIFEHLPVAGQTDRFERFWATPQTVDFATLCAAHGVEHVSVKDSAHLKTLLTPLPTSGVRVLEIRTDRKADLRAQQTLFQAAAQSVSRIQAISEI